ncbi:CehA/McbA family metallohydrolase [Roseiflexus sp.]|uniref:CehA/McbA family metallohydrolase n=1 Tax=Roseiflexus sp. TaxID=2562120 RepID=UPI00398A9174
MHTIFDGALTEREWKRHISHPFEVAPGATRMFIRLHFDPLTVGGIDNMLCLSLFDPNGFRGAGHRGGAQHNVTIDAVRATPGYLPGPLPAGQWNAVIDTHMVASGAPCRYTLTITTTDDPVEGATESPNVSVVKTPGRGWYRGDLHAHTIHSDGDWDIPDLIAAARDRRLDFVTLTDHNTISQLRDIDTLTTSDLLVMGGMELTTFWGHALSLGTRHWIDWRIRPGERSMPLIAAEIEKEGGLFVIAHPLAPGDPYCTGCDWRYVEMMPGTARAVEVWNGLWNGDSNNEAALALWYEWLNWGLRITATAGTDAHGPAPAAARPGFNVVYAPRREEGAILRAISHGRLFLSSGPTLELTGTSGETHAMLGDTLPRGAATVHLRWRDVPAGARLRFIVDGARLSEDTIDPTGERAWNLDEGAAQWCVAEIRAADDELLAVTNPIYFAGEE